VQPRVVLGVLGLAVLVAACGGGSDTRPSLSRSVAPPPCSHPLFSTPVNCVADPVGSSVHVYANPLAATPKLTLPNPWLLNDDPNLKVPQKLLVSERQGPWLRVVLPVRPNGTTGWVKASDVLLQQDPYRILVQLGAHHLIVYSGSSIVTQDTIAIGTPLTPTPTGTYYLRVLLKAPDPTTVYGPYAYGLSGHSNALTTYLGGDAELGIHGNNDASVLGQSISHGCIRMSNDKITALAGLLPLGTPVQILA
jgi:lipoprotein-anchoring transpeptidase ErfK/SrfK